VRIWNLELALATRGRGLASGTGVPPVCFKNGVSKHQERTGGTPVPLRFGLAAFAANGGSFGTANDWQKLKVES